MESIGRLAGGVAHDFNNMLGVISGYADMAILVTPHDDKRYTFMTEIKKAAERSAAITKQLLAFARQQTASPEVVNLNEIIENMLKMLYRLIGEDIALNFIPEDDLWQIKIDPSQIDQILANLCVNAKDSITGAGIITIETKNIAASGDFCIKNNIATPTDFVMIAVSDNGCGMDKETVVRIFEPFFSTKSVGKGTGLGLATVYGIVKQNGGFINVYSEIGQGSVFKIYIPRVLASAVKRVSVEVLKVEKLRGLRVLLVEDEPLLLEMSSRILNELGVHVIPAAKPSAALDIVRDSSLSIDVVLTDVIMPEMNGRELSKKILEIRPDIKCVFMSGYTDNVIAQHGVLEKGVNFIQKPFTVNDLISKLSALR